MKKNEIEQTAGLYVGPDSLEEQQRALAQQEEEDLKEVYENNKELSETRTMLRVEAEKFPEIPPGIARDYYDLYSELTYSYKPFHFASFITLLSTIVGYTAMSRQNDRDIYLNLFTFCTGPSSTSGKSTANKKVAITFFPRIAPQLQDLYLLQPGGTPKSVAQDLEKHYCRLWWWDECGEYFQKIKRPVYEDLKTHLLRLGDCSPVVHRISETGGKVPLKSEWRQDHPFVSLLWNLTIEDLQKNVSSDITTNGFLLRSLWFVCHTPNNRKPHRDMTKLEIDLQSRLINDLISVGKELNGLYAKLGAPIPGSTEAHPCFPLWPDPFVCGLLDFCISPVIEAWLEQIANKYPVTDYSVEANTYRTCNSRLDSQTYVIAMLLSLLDPDVRKEIRSIPAGRENFPYKLKIPDVWAKFAVELSENYLRPNLAEILSMSEVPERTDQMGRIVSYLKSQGGIATGTEIQTNTHILSKHLKEVLLSLEDSGEIYHTKESTRGAPRNIYKLSSIHPRS